MPINQPSSTGNVLDRHHKAAVEFVAWADHHGQRDRLRKAALGQIEDHPDQKDAANAVAQQLAWARRHGRDRRLHDSAIAQLRHDV
ncbi:MAG: hypothetical protein ACON4T_07105 [Synechococcus sp.]